MTVVLTALNVEYRAVREQLADLTVRRHPAGTLFEIGLLPGTGWAVAIGGTGEGNHAAAVIAERAITLFHPVALIFVGVAGALKDDIALGDVVVATRVYLHHGGKDEGDEFLVRPRSWEAPHHLDQAARHVDRTGGWLHRLPEPARRQPPSVHFAPIVAGDVVLNSRTSALAERIRRHYNDAVAIEMESAGAAHAGHLNQSLPVLTVRGISDAADGGKADADRQGWQAVAARHAATFALALVADLPARGLAEQAVPVRSGPGAAPGVGPSASGRHRDAAGGGGAAESTIRFEAHILRKGRGGAAEDFEQMLALLVQAELGQAGLAFVNPSDWGVDALVSDPTEDGGVTVWQAAYLMQGITRQHHEAIRESFESALRAARVNGCRVDRWVLCVPSTMDDSTAAWWREWASDARTVNALMIELWDESVLRSRLALPRARHVRRLFYDTR